MGLLDQLAGQFLGGGAEGGSSPLLQMAMQLLQNHEGGLGGLLAQLNQAGLADQVKSWVGTGSNLPVSGDQLAAALGPDTLGKLAGALGLDPGAVSEQLAQGLPQLVDKLTPNGSLDGSGDLLAQGLSALFRS
ncbi:YidB family protein [Niveibacterium sp. 24ML]|uniref:YidB family protein n=1 Tax=Niveibacterium sp. 24ML TaxID=2985512 RepID=UPI00226F3BAC|nr:YidB family protein [Niveibacterium sp. 24ML]MCX9158169.1 YidB family protein [Niveibacterium sp. 24ML]